MQLDFAQRHAHVNAEDVRMRSRRALEWVYYVKGVAPCLRVADGANRGVA